MVCERRSSFSGWSSLSVMAVRSGEFPAKREQRLHHDLLLQLMADLVEHCFPLLTDLAGGLVELPPRRVAPGLQRELRALAGDLFGHARRFTHGPRGLLQLVIQLIQRAL